MNLTSGKKKTDDIPLNVSVMFHEHVITRNSRINGKWGIQENGQNLSTNDPNDIANLNPIKSGDIFKFYILIGDTKFHIAINNKSFCTFSYRLPINSIRTIQLKHNLQFVTQVDQRLIFPFPHPSIQYDDKKYVFSNDAPKPFKFGKKIIDKHSNIQIFILIDF